MRLGKKTTVVLAIAAGLLLTGWARESRAGLFDWLFPGRAARTQAPPILLSSVPVTAGAPTTSAYWPVVMANYPAAYRAAYPAATAYYPATVAPQPVVAASPVYAAQPVVAGYASQATVAYRTQMVQVPVTVYRPMAAVDPVTGLPITVMRPCTTTTWQARRVPAGGLFGGLTALYAPSYYPTTAAGLIVAPAAPAPVVSAPAMIVPQAAPLPNGPAIPAEVPPVPADSSFPTIPTAPLNPVTPAQPSTPMGSTPADAAPALPSGSYYPPSSSSYIPIPQASATRVVPNSGAGTGSAVQQKPAAATNVTPPLTPVPDPDALPRHEKVNEAPALLNPRDRTASAPRNWAVTPITWTPPAEEHRGPATATATVRAVQPAEEVWDDTGWHAPRK